MTRWMTFTFAAALTLLGAGRAQPPAAHKLDLNQNAALKYWRAFASMPHLSEEEQEKLRGKAAGLTTPLDAKAKDLIAKSSNALHELHNGAKVSQCAWGVTMEDGLSARLNELQAARALTT